MVSTRQQSNVGSGGDNSGSELVGTTRSVRHTTSQSQSGHNGHEIVPVSLSSSSQPFVSNLKLLDLPHEVLEKIFSYIGYKNVSHMRLVCRQLDQVCSAILNSTFQRLQTQMLHRFQGIKAKMPRRESARRNHPLACESDIIETLHMRLTLLQMSFGKHIERKHCCFFAGEVSAAPCIFGVDGCLDTDCIVWNVEQLAMPNNTILDEVYRILHYIKVTPKLARPYKVTDELFDLSTMAMEYFKEHIEPTLPEIAYFGTDFIDFTSTTSVKFLCLDSPPHGPVKGDESPGLQIGHADERQPHPPAQANIVLKKRIRKIKQGMKRYNYQLCQMRRELRHCRGKIAEQQKQILEYASRLDEYDKKNEETSRKFSTLLQELNKCKTELQYWRSKSPLNPVCIGCGQGMAPTPSEDLEALSNQGILLPELVAEEPPLFPLPPTPALPGTSADDMWTAWEGEEPTKGKEVEKPAADARSKRKSTTSSDHSNSSRSGHPPAKKPRYVLKARSKRL